jgi:hydrogenase maturation factor
LTKAAGLEGTHVLANDLADRLVGRVANRLLREARGYAEELSVVPEARLAAELGATAMHDPTEAGVVGALWEMAEASRCGFRVRVSAIPVRDPTRAICEVLGVDPLRLIASGALLIACRDGGAMARGLRERGVAAAEIGAMTADGDGRLLVYDDGHEEPITRLERDELYRVLDDPNL